MKEELKSWLRSPHIPTLPAKLPPWTAQTLLLVLLLISVCALLLWKRRLRRRARTRIASRDWSPFSASTSAPNSPTTITLVATESPPDELSLSPGNNPGEYVGSDGKEYCLPSTLGGFDLDPEAQHRVNLENRVGVLEKSVEALAIKAAQGKTKP